MQDLNGKIAFVTGGGTGIGLSIARALAKRGASIMLADIDPMRLKQAKADLLSLHSEIDTVVCDVSDVAAVKAASEAVLKRFGAVHIVANNAGVGLLGGELGTVPEEDWRWIVDINLMGVVHGIDIFAPLMRTQGEGGYFVNTASVAGHIAAPGMGPYTATKYAVVALSETLRQELSEDGIDVSVLCPGWVRTDIGASARNRPSGQAEGTPKGEQVSQDVMDALASGLEPDVVGEWVAESMAAKRFYIFTHPSMQEHINTRAAEIAADYAACAADPRFKGF